MKGADAGTGKLKFDYLEIPVLLKVRIPISSFHPFIFAGPAFGFSLKAVLDGVKIDDMPAADTAPFSAEASSWDARSMSTSGTRWGSEARDPRPRDDRPEERRALGDARPGFLSETIPAS